MTTTTETKKGWKYLVRLRKNGESRYYECRARHFKAAAREAVQHIDHDDADGLIYVSRLPRALMQVKSYRLDQIRS